MKLACQSLKSFTEDRLIVPIETKLCQCCEICISDIWDMRWSRNDNLWCTSAMLLPREPGTNSLLGKCSNMLALRVNYLLALMMIACVVGSVQWFLSLVSALTQIMDPDEQKRRLTAYRRTDRVNKSTPVLVRSCRHNWPLSFPFMSLVSEEEKLHLVWQQQVR